MKWSLRDMFTWLLIVALSLYVWRMERALEQRIAACEGPCSINDQRKFAALWYGWGKSCECCAHCECGK